MSKSKTVEVTLLLLQEAPSNRFEEKTSGPNSVMFLNFFLYLQTNQMN